MLFLHSKCRRIPEGVHSCSNSTPIALLSLDLLVLLDMNVFVGLEDADLVIGELDTKKEKIS